MVLDAGHKVNFLLDIAPALTPGAIVTVYPKLVSRLRDSTLFNAAVDYIDGTDHSDREIGLPAVITDVRFNEDKPLNLGEWSVRVAVPGEEHLKLDGQFLYPFQSKVIGTCYATRDSLDAFES